MHDVNYEYVKISDILIPKNGNSELTMDYSRMHPGKYPIYSSNNSEIFGFCDKYDYDGNYLTWSIVGCAGYITELSGKFSITNNRGIIIIKEEYKEIIDIKYLKYILEPIFRKNIKGRLGLEGKNEYTQLNRKMVREIEEKIPIPIKLNGKFDLEKQKEIAEKYEVIRNYKEKMEMQKKQVKDIVIDYNQGLKLKYVRITDLFTPMLGNGKYTKKECRNNHGEYHVYSGNTVSYYDKINEYTYDGEYLTWAKDGLAGYIMYHNEKFSITNHRGILIPTENCKNIDLHFIKYMLEPIFRRNIKGRLGLEGKNEYTTLSKEMIKNIKEKIPVPITDNGEFDLKKQREIANEIEKVNKIKETIINKIDELINRIIILI